MFPQLPSCLSLGHQEPSPKGPIGDCTSGGHKCHIGHLQHLVEREGDVESALVGADPQRCQTKKWGLPQCDSPISLLGIGVEVRSGRNRAKGGQGKGRIGPMWGAGMVTVSIAEF